MHYKTVTVFAYNIANRLLPASIIVCTIKLSSFFVYNIANRLPLLHNNFIIAEILCYYILMSDATQNLTELQNHLAHIKQEQPNICADELTMIAVSKTFGAEYIIPFLQLGLRHFGENRVQEAVAKWAALKTEYPDTILHLIGPLQRNKVKQAVELFDVIHTVDRVALLEPLANAFAQQQRNLPIFVQVNISQEEQKSGIDPTQLDEFITLIKQKYRMNLMGLMCIPAADENPAPYFAQLNQMGKKHGLPYLSMGMSNDYDVAVKFGATHIRVGSKLFGAR